MPFRPQHDVNSVTREDADVHVRGKAICVAPRIESIGRVSANEQFNQPSLGDELFDCVNGVGRTGAANFAIGDFDAVKLRERDCRHCESQRRRGCHSPLIFLPRFSGHGDEELAESTGVPRGSQCGDMAVVGRIEGAAEEPESLSRHVFSLRGAVQRTSGPSSLNV